MSKLIEYVGLDQTGTNFDRSVFDPKGFPLNAYYDALCNCVIPCLCLDNRQLERNPKTRDPTGKLSQNFIPSIIQE